MEAWVWFVILIGLGLIFLGIIEWYLSDPRN